MAKHKANHLVKKKVFVVGGIILLTFLAAGAGMLVWWLQNKGKVDQQTTPSTNAPNPLPSTINKAQNLAVNGNVNQSNQVIQDALKQQNVSNQQKFDLLIQQGVNYTNTNQNQLALNSFLEADKIQSNFTSSHLIGETYEALGDKPDAITYYKKAITQLDTKAISYNQDKKIYQDKITALGGQP